MSWEELRREYADRGLALGLGAGVSIDSRLPSWPELLRRVANDPDCRESGATFDEMAHFGLGLPAIASILERRYGDRRAFAEAVRRALYSDFPFFPGGYPKGDVRHFVESVQQSNETLRAIAALCAIARPDRRGYIPNPRIKAIVTFNLDAVLQAFVFA